MAIIGIDLGTTNSLGAVWKDGSCRLIPNAFGEYLTPSAVSIEENGEILVGKTAKERLISHPERTASLFKQFMGTDKKYDLGDKSFLPEDLSSFVLRQIKTDAEEYLGEEIHEAVISVPAYFNDKQRAATKNAGILAGLKVERIINEPSAAALAYQSDGEMDGLYLVVDFGGGTLDVSLVEIFDNIVDIVGVAGDNHIGGSDIDKALYEAFLRENPRLKGSLTENERASLLRVCEQCKIALTSAPKQLMVYQRGGESYAMALSNQILLNICKPLLERIKATLHTALMNSGNSIRDITEVVLVGGSCHMPIMKQYMKRLTGKEPMQGINPDLVVGYGVGMISGIKSRVNGVRDMILTDVCPFSLGTEISTKSGMSQFCPLIQRNSSLPSSVERRFTTLNDFQTQLNVDIYQGESINVEQNLKLGEIIIDIPRAKAGEIYIMVRFTYDINGILEVDVYCPANGRREHELMVSNDQLSNDEVEKRLNELSELKIAPADKAENRQLLARAERLFEEHSGPVREEVGSAAAYFSQMLDKGGSPAKIAKLRQELTDFFDRIDFFDDGLMDSTRPEEWEN